MCYADSFGSDYIARIQKIWKLTEPPSHQDSTTKSFYNKFKIQYEKARRLSADNSLFSRSVLFPLIRSEEPLSEPDKQQIEQFCCQLIELDNLKFTDWILCLKLYDRLIFDARIQNQRRKMLSIITPTIRLLYHLCDVFRREDTPEARTLQEHYKEIALSYIQEARQWLVHDVFRTLTTQEQADVLRINRLESLFWYPDPDNLRASVHIRLSTAMDALNLVCDPVYRKENPDFPWEEEESACLYYASICSCIISMDDDIDPKDIRTLYEVCQKQHRIVLENRSPYTDAFSSEQMLHFMQYLCHEITPDQYLNEISVDYKKRDQKRCDATGINENVYRPAQILEVLVHHLDTPEHLLYMDTIYRDLISYANAMPNNEYQELFLVYTLISLNLFQERKDGIPYSEICSALLASCSPSTFVHSMMVGKIAQMLGEALFVSNPELFAGLCEDTDAADRKASIGSLLYECGIYHDFGKLPYLDTIGITYRPLFPDEIDIIRLHPNAGRKLLDRNPSTSFFADVAWGHHRWYDETAGYPPDFCRSACRFPILIDIIAIADCLDAATDIIFRSYNKGITLSDFILEAREGAGTRYSPDVVSVFSEEELFEQLSELLTKGREEAYLTAYHIKP